MMGAMKILDPIGSSAAGAQSLAPRPATLQGVVVGVLDNAKPNARGLMTRMEQGKDLMVIVAGGAGKHSAAVFTFGSTRSVTRRIEA